MRGIGTIGRLTPGMGRQRQASSAVPGYVYGADLITNGSFEIAGAGGADVFNWWLETPGTGGTIAADAVNFYAGAKSAALTSGTNTSGCYLRSAVMTVTPGQMYQFTRYIRGDGTNDGKLSVYDTTHSGYIKQLQQNRVTGAGWVRRDTLFIPPAGCTQVQLFLFAPAVIGGIVNYDLVSLQAWQPPQYLYDNFQRADGDPDKSPLGFPYDLQNTAGNHPMIIKDKVLDIPDAEIGYWYNFVDLPKTPTLMSASFRWKNNGADIGDSVVLTSSNARFLFSTYKHMLHFYVTTSQWVFQTVDDAGAFTTLQSGALTLSPGVDYTLAMAINGNTVTLTIPTIASVEINDASLSALAGQYVYYELIRTVAGRKSGVFNWIDARW